MKQTKFMALLLFAGMTLVACDDDENEIEPSEQQNTMTLTFEGSSWNSLIDNPQYYGPLLYGENAKDYAWTDATTQLHGGMTNAWGKCPLKAEHLGSVATEEASSNYPEITNHQNHLLGQSKEREGVKLLLLPLLLRLA